MMDMGAVPVLMRGESGEAADHDLDERRLLR
jgi:hypothetical protein